MTENQTPSSKEPSKSRPKPGPLPGARPAAAPAPDVQTSPPAESPQSSHAPNDPKKYGRIDEQGTVYLITPDGEREIGSWQAGTVDEGFAHYGSRFDDLTTEVNLLSQRLVNHPGEAQSISNKAKEIKQSLTTAAVLGDLAALDAQLDLLEGQTVQAAVVAQENKQKRRAKALSKKESLAAEAEEIADNSTEWRKAGNRIREILDEWKTIRGIDRKTDDELWKRYSKARDVFNRRRGAHFAELDRSRATARKKKEELVERAKLLTDSTDWNETARAFRDLMTEWKAAGRAPKEVEDKLWSEFKAAQDNFFDNRNANSKERDREFEANAQAKLALLNEYEPLIDPAKGQDTARAKLRELQDKWEAIGFVPRQQVQEFEKRIKAIETRVAEAEDAMWRRSDPAALARAEQFAAKAAELQAQADSASAKGDRKKAGKLKAQAEQWKEWADMAHQAIDNR